MRLKCPEKEWNPLSRSLLVELNVWVNGVDMLQKLVAVFCHLDNKGVIHIPKPLPRWIGG